MLSIIEKVIFLQKVDVFADVPTEYLAYLAAITKEVACHKGDVIYKENDPSDALYLVREGKVRLHRGGEEITVAGSGDAFGTWAIFDEEPRLVTATVLEETQLLQIDREDFFDLLADHVRISQSIMKTMSTRLRNLANRVGIDTSSPISD